MVNILTPIDFSPIVDATNRPGLDRFDTFSPLDLGVFSYVNYLPIPMPSFGFFIPPLWRNPVLDAGFRLLGWNDLWQAEPEYHSYVWNALMWQNYFPAMPPMPQFFNPWPAVSYQPQGVSVVGTPMPKSEPPPAEKPKEEEDNSKKENGGRDQTKISSNMRPPRRQSQQMNTISISKQGLPSDPAQARQELMNRLVQTLGGEGDLRRFQDHEGRWRDVYLLSNGKTYILEDRGSQIIATEYPI